MEFLVGTAPIHGDRLLFSPFRPAAAAAAKLAPALPSLRLPASPPHKPRAPRVRAASDSDPHSPILRTLRTAASGAVIFSAATSSLLSLAFSPPPARADPSAPPSATEETTDHSTLSQLLDSSPDAVDALRSLLYRKLEDGDDIEALSLLRRLIAARPAESEWKLLAARLLAEMGDAAESRRLLEEVLAAEPLSFEALFENAVLMDRSGEGGAVLERLEQALELARAEHKDREARDVRLIMAQMQFLQKKVDEALASYEELAREDPKDYRPFFCQGVIYSLLERNNEAREKFCKYHELSPKKVEVDAYLQTPLSRMRLFGTGDAKP